MGSLSLCIIARCKERAAYIELTCGMESAVCAPDNATHSASFSTTLNNGGSDSKVKGHLEVDAAVGRGRGEESSCQRIRLTEQRRLQNPNRRSKVYVVEDVSTHGCEAQRI